ncbi:MAG: four helix bundle protein [Gemmatimonadetes bacterium]|nr:four helix bundle protein [Gemmatimonadota bacterium]
MHPHERLTAWQKAHDFTLAVLRSIERPPRAGHLVVVNQLRRAAISVTTNIVEGASRDSAEQFASFLNISLGSARECSYLICLSAELGAISSASRATLEARCDQVCRLIVPLKRHLQRAIAAKPPRPRATRAARAARTARASPT